MTTMTTTIERGGVIVDFDITLLPNGQTRYRVWNTDFGDTQEDRWPSHHWRTHANELARQIICELEHRLQRGFVVQMCEVGQAYGGPEEGGWWYDYRQPIECWFRTTLAEAAALKQELMDDAAEGRGYSPDGRDYDDGTSFSIRFDPDEGRWPPVRPTYS